MLELKKINAGYGELQVLKNVNLHVNHGEIIALIGPNGAGKSTVIKSIFNLTNISSGRVIFKEKDITNLKTHELVELGIAYVNQGKIVFGNLTVQENVEIGINMIKDKDIIENNLEMIYQKFPVLKEKKTQLAYCLSGGQRQQLALGRALMQNPSLLLMDEPSLGLSPKLQKELFRTIADLREMGISVLVVEQNAKKAIEIADRTYLLEQGEVVLTGGKDILKHKKIKNVYLGGVY